MGAASRQAAYTRRRNLQARYTAITTTIHLLELPVIRFDASLSISRGAPYAMCGVIHACSSVHKIHLSLLPLGQSLLK